MLIVYFFMYEYGMKEGDTEEENNGYPVVFTWNFRESAVLEFRTHFSRKQAHKFGHWRRNGVVAEGVGGWRYSAQPAPLSTVAKFIVPDWGDKVISLWRGFD